MQNSEENNQEEIKKEKENKAHKKELTDVQEEEFILPETFIGLRLLEGEIDPSSGIKLSPTPTTVMIFQKALKNNPTKALIELIEISVKHLEFKKLKTLDVEKIKNMESLEDEPTSYYYKLISNHQIKPFKVKNYMELEEFSSEKKSFYFKLNEHLELLLLEACVMTDIKSRNDKITKIYYWYQDKLDFHRRTCRINERTEKDPDQLDDEEYLLAKAENEEKFYYDLDGNEVDEATAKKLRRNDIPGYDKKEKLNDFIHKQINSKEIARLLQLNELTDPNHYYFGKNKPANENIFNAEYNSNGFNQFNATFSKDIFNSTSYGNASSFGNSTYYTTQTTMKFANKTGYNNVNGLGYNYNNRAEFNFNKTTSPGWISNNIIGNNNNFGIYDKEIKSNYAFNRPKYQLESLNLENRIIRDKHKELRHKRMDEEIKLGLMDFGDNRARYKGDLNKLYEMKEMIKNYNKVIKQKQLEEIKFNEQFSNTTNNGNKKDKLPPLKTENNTQLDNENNDKNIKTTIDANIVSTEDNNNINTDNIDNKENINNTENNNINETNQNNESNENNNINEEIEKKNEKPKVDIEHVKYITQNNNLKANNDYQDYSEEEEENKCKEKIFNIKVHLRIDVATDNLYRTLNKKLEKDRQLNEQLNHNEGLANDKNFQKERAENILDSEVTIGLGRVNNVFKYRKLYNRINNFDICIDKICNTQLKPLSFFDDENIQKRTTKRSGFIIENEKLNTENDIIRSNLNKCNDDFLQMRKTLSQFHRNKIRSSKIFKRGDKKIKYIIKNIYNNDFK